MAKSKTTRRQREADAHLERARGLATAAELLWGVRMYLVDSIERSRETVAPAAMAGTEFIHVDSRSLQSWIEMLDAATTDVFRATLPPLLAYGYQPPPPLTDRFAPKAPRPRTALRGIAGGRT